MVVSDLSESITCFLRLEVTAPGQLTETRLRWIGHKTVANNRISGLTEAACDGRFGGGVNAFLVSTKVAFSRGVRSKRRPELVQRDHLRWVCSTCSGGRSPRRLCGDGSPNSGRRRVR